MVIKSATALTEDSPNTFFGSFTKDLIFSKMWLCSELHKVCNTAELNNFSELTILGSWYGNMLLIMGHWPFKFSKAVLIDIDPQLIRKTKYLFSNKIESVFPICQDANNHDYSSAKNQLIVNTSCNDINGADWFNKIPTGSMVALQSRNDRESPELFNQRYPMAKTYFSGSRMFNDPEGSYRRLMKIGTAR